MKKNKNKKKERKKERRKKKGLTVSAPALPRSFTVHFCLASSARRRLPWSARHLVQR
jgi:hypothetical protein